MDLGYSMRAGFKLGLNHSNLRIASGLAGTCGSRVAVVPRAWLTRRNGLIGMASGGLVFFPDWCKGQEAAYDSVAEEYDILDGGGLSQLFGVTSLRQKLLTEAAGQILEVGIGTGLNLQWYLPERVDHLSGIDISSGMLGVASRKASFLGWKPRITLTQGDAANLPFPDNSFDCVVDTYSMCVYPDPLAVLREMSRVVKPKGKILLLEHSRSGIPAVGCYQDIVARPVAAMSKGCLWNQNLLELIQQANIVILNSSGSLGGLVSLVIAEKGNSL